jgi:hypothetical protein
VLQFDGALYLLATDAGYLDEPNVVWELLNEIDGDTAYLDAQFRPVTSSEQQESILTQQQKQREQEQEEAEELQKARDLSLSGGNSQAGGGDTRAAEHTMPSAGLFGESTEENEENLDPDYLLALRFQREEEELARANKRVSPRVSPRPLQPIGAARDVSITTAQAQPAGGCEDDGDEDGDEGMRSEQIDERTQEASENEFIPVSADGQMLVSEEELEAQRQAERFYQEQKQRVDAQTRQHQQEQERLRRQQQQIRGGQRRRASEGSDCTVS